MRTSRIRRDVGKSVILHPWLAMSPCICPLELPKSQEAARPRPFPPHNIQPHARHPWPPPPQHRHRHSSRSSSATATSSHGLLRVPATLSPALRTRGVVVFVPPAPRPRQGGRLRAVVHAGGGRGPRRAAGAEGRAAGGRVLGAQGEVPHGAEPAGEGEAGEGAHGAVHGGRYQGPRQDPHGGDRRRQAHQGRRRRPPQVARPLPPPQAPVRAVHDASEASQRRDDKRADAVPGERDRGLRQGRVRGRDDPAELADPRRDAPGRSGHPRRARRRRAHQPAERHGQRAQPRRQPARRHRPRRDRRHAPLHQPALLLHHQQLPGEHRHHQPAEEMERVRDRVARPVRAPAHQRPGVHAGGQGRQVRVQPSGGRVHQPQEVGRGAAARRLGPRRRHHPRVQGHPRGLPGPRQQGQPAEDSHDVAHRRTRDGGVPVGGGEEDAERGAGARGGGGPHRRQVGAAGLPRGAPAEAGRPVVRGAARARGPASGPGHVRAGAPRRRVRLRRAPADGGAEHRAPQREERAAGRAPRGAAAAGAALAGAVAAAPGPGGVHGQPVLRAGHHRDQGAGAAGDAGGGEARGRAAAGAHALDGVPQQLRPGAGGGHRLHGVPHQGQRRQDRRGGGHLRRRPRRERLAPGGRVQEGRAVQGSGARRRRPPGRALRGRAQGEGGGRGVGLWRTTHRAGLLQTLMSELPFVVK